MPFVDPKDVDNVWMFFMVLHPLVVVACGLWCCSPKRLCLRTCLKLCGVLSLWVPMVLALMAFVFVEHLTFGD